MFNATAFFEYMKSFKYFVFAHKIISTVVLVVVLGGGYWVYTARTSTSGETRYILGTVQKGTVIASISASGQVAASDQTDIKAKAAGDIVSISAKEGQRVVQGQAIASIDSTDARRAVTDAKLAVEEAQINLEHDTLQAPIDFKKLQEDVDRAQRDLDSSYDDAYTALSDAFIKLPDIISGTDSILHHTDIVANTQNVSAYPALFISAPTDQTAIQTLATRAENDYNAAREAYTISLNAFKALSRVSGQQTIADTLKQANDMSALLAKAAVSETNLIDSTIDTLNRRSWNVAAAIPAAQTNARSYVSSANSVLSSLTAAQKNIQNMKDALIDAQHALQLGSVGDSTGANPISLKLTDNTLKQKQAALADAEQALADTVIRAPYPGVLAKLTVKRADTVANGASVGTLISDQKIAQLSLNEVDAAKLKVGDKATLTFDAIDTLTLTGSVAEIDSLGTVAQGVVSYTVKIGFDSDDVRIKPGMTVNAAIIIDAHQDVLTVPSSAVKSQGANKYVLVFNPALPERDISAGGAQGVTSTQTPQQIPVEVGLSDDTNVEILSGLTEGEQIITRTITAATAAASTAATRTGTGGAGGARGGGFGAGAPVFIGR